MRVKILPSGLNDLAAGRSFYEPQNPGVGDFFLDSLFSDIDSLALYGGIHRQTSGYFVMLAKRFGIRSPFRVISVFRGQTNQERPLTTEDAEGRGAWRMSVFRLA